MGKVTSLTALLYGPGGPSCAIMGLSGPFLVILQALVQLKMIKATELLALLICFSGSMILIVPDITKKILCWVCIKFKK